MNWKEVARAFLPDSASSMKSVNSNRHGRSAGGGLAGATGLVARSFLNTDQHGW